MVDEAAIDAYDEDGELLGMHTMIDDNLIVPLETTVLGLWGDA
jgi:hypothetical protein